MTKRGAFLIASLWALSLLAVARWNALAQVTSPPGVEVRFLKSTGHNGAVTGTLVGNFDGQWLPIKIDLAGLPDGNGVVR